MLLILHFILRFAFHLSILCVEIIAVCSMRNRCGWESEKETSLRCNYISMNRSVLMHFQLISSIGRSQRNEEKKTRQYMNIMRTLKSQFQKIYCPSCVSVRFGFCLILSYKTNFRMFFFSLNRLKRLMNARMLNDTFWIIANGLLELIKQMWAPKAQPLF